MEGGRIGGLLCGGRRGHVGALDRIRLREEEEEKEKREGYLNYEGFHHFRY
jgi:hypothetical protein